MNTYLIKIWFYNAKQFDIEIKAESSILAVRTIFEDLNLTKKFKDKNIDTIKVNRLT
jgi:hypothetical protein